MLSSPAIVAAAVSEEEDTYSVTITTQPRQGPFRINQTVQFSCSVHPTPPRDLTYQWRTVEAISGGSSFIRQSYNRTYSERYLHYCYYYCEVSANGTVVGSTSRIVEVLGELMGHQLTSFRFCVQVCCILWGQWCGVSLVVATCC